LVGNESFGLPWATDVLNRLRYTRDAAPVGRDEYERDSATEVPMDNRMSSFMAGGALQSIGHVLSGRGYWRHGFLFKSCIGL
jgi:hypothetical protein